MSTKPMVLLHEMFERVILNPMYPNNALRALTRYSCYPFNGEIHPTFSPELYIDTEANVQ